MNKNDLKLNKENFVLGDTILFEHKTFNNVKIKRNFFIASEPPITLLTINSCFTTNDITIGNIFPIESSTGSFYKGHFYLIGENFEKLICSKMLLIEKVIDEK